MFRAMARYMTNPIPGESVMKNTDDKLKPRYLDTIRDLVQAALRKNALLNYELCACQGTPEQKDIQALAEVNRGIDKYCNQLKAIEAETNDTFGIAALLKEDVPDSVRIALAILTAQVLTGEVTIHDIAHLSELAAGREPEGLVQIHEAFTCSPSGVLRTHCSLNFRNAKNLGQVRPTLMESAFRIVCGLSVDVEFDEIIRVETLARG
jgi:hypothetical protein